VIDFIVNDILRWVCLYVLLWNAYILIFNKGIPNIRTAPAIRKRIISLLKEEAKSRGGNPFTIVDMGSGNGLFTRQIAQSLPGARVIGLETSKLAFDWSVFFKKLYRLENLEYHRTDFFTYDLSHADAVVMYLTIFQMESMGKKLHQDLKPGALATSNRFPLGDGWMPVESIPVRTFYPHQKTFHVYRK